MPSVGLLMHLGRPKSQRNTNVPDAGSRWSIWFRSAGSLAHLCDIRTRSPSDTWSPKSLGAFRVFLVTHLVLLL